MIFTHSCNYNNKACSKICRIHKFENFLWNENQSDHFLVRPLGVTLAILIFTKLLNTYPVQPHLKHDIKAYLLQ